MREVAASRRRLVEAGDEQRRRLREQLRGGAEQMLAEVSAELRRVAAHHDGDTAVALVALVDELDAASADLARFAQGVHPGHSPSAGSPRRSVTWPAMRQSRSSWTCRHDVSQRRRRPRCTSCARRHSQTSPSTPGQLAHRSSVVDGGTRLVVCVTDDGQGGADPREVPAFVV